MEAKTRENRGSACVAVFPSAALRCQDRNGLYVERMWGFVGLAAAVSEDRLVRHIGFCWTQTIGLATRREYELMNCLPRYATSNLVHSRTK